MLGIWLVSSLRDGVRGTAILVAYLWRTVVDGCLTEDGNSSVCLRGLFTSLSRFEDIIDASRIFRLSLYQDTGSSDQLFYVRC